MRASAIIIISLLTSQLVWAAKIEEVSSFLDRSIYSCSERIWDGLDWKKLKISLVSKNQNQILKIHNGEKQSSILNQSDFMNSIFEMKDNEVRINVDAFDNSKDAFALTVHEGFHAFGQKSLNYSTAGRDESYPQNAEPRVEREELARSIIGYFRGEVGALEKAAGWHKRHLENKEDLGSDIIEGSAEYVEKISLAILELGCGSADINLVNHAVDSLANQGADFDKSYEHYRIGALSFLLARPKFEYVLSHLDGKATALDIIFKDVIADENIYPDSLLSHSAEMSINIINKRAEETVQAVEVAIANKKRLSFVPFSKMTGSFTHQGSYLSSGKTYYQNIEIELRGKNLSGHAVKTTACNNQEGFLIADPNSSDDGVVTCY